MNPDYLLLLCFIAMLCGTFALVALVAEWLAQNPDAAITRWLDKWFRLFGF